MNINPKVPVDRTLMDTGYYYKPRKVLVFIATERAGSTDPGDPYYIFYLRIIIILPP